MSKQLRVGQNAPETTIYDADGQPINIGRLWADGPILLTFLRHFG